MNKTVKIILLSVLVLFAASVAFFCITIKKSAPANDVAAEKARQEDYNNCIVLNKQNATVKVEDTKSLVQYEDLHNQLKPYLSRLKKAEVNIIVLEDVPYKNVVDVLDEMTIENVPKYKLLKTE